jgi:hypothetical protein
VRILAHTTVAGRRTETVLTGDRDTLLGFLEAHLFDEKVVLADSGDQLIFEAVDGVDLYSRLDEFGIDLPSLYRRLRELAVSAASDDREREPREDLYDSVGLSPAEIAMRQKAKRAARAARTGADVVGLLAGTYFEASFESEDGSRCWSSFDPGDLSAVEEAQNGAGEPVGLRLDTRVRHRGSREDIHSFVLLDMPVPRTVGPPEGP